MLPPIINDWNLDKIAMFQRFRLKSVLGSLNLAQLSNHSNTHPNTSIPKKAMCGYFPVQAFSTSARTMGILV